MCVLLYFFFFEAPALLLCVFERSFWPFKNTGNSIYVFVNLFVAELNLGALTHANQMLCC